MMVEEKEIYKLISETMHEGLLELDLHGKIVRANPAALSMLGFTLQEITQKTHRDLTPAKWHQLESQAIQETNLAQHKDIVLEQEYLRKDGSVFPVALKPILLTGPDQKPIKIIILCQDLTRQKEQERLRQDHQRQLNSLSLITRKLQENDTADQTVHFVLEALAAAMKYPEVAVPLIAIEDETFSTNKYSDELDYGLTASLFVNGHEAGEVTVYYSENKPFVLPDEQHILETVAQSMGVWLAQKSAAQELADMEEQYQSIFDSMADGFALYEIKDEGRELIVMDWNRAAEKMYNLLQHDVLGQDIKKFFPAMEKTDIYKAILDCWKSGENKIIPLVHYQDAQHDQYMHNVIYRVGDKVAVIFRDVTEEEKTRQELVRSEQKFRSLIEGSAEAIYLHTLGPVNPQFVDINQSACQMLHYTREELLIMGPAKIDSPEFAALIPERVARILKEGKALFESEHMTKEGALIPVEINASVVELGGQEYILSFVRDITERKQAEAVLKENQGFLKNIVENIPDMIFVKDAETLCFKLLNKAGENLLGHSKEELYGKNDYDFFPQDEAEHFVKKDREVLNAKKELDIPEEKILTKDKGERFLHTKKIPILNEKGTPVYLLGISEDITERKKTNDALRKQQQELSTILDSTPAMIFYKDKENKFIRVNQALAKGTGLTREEMEDKSLFDIYPKDAAEHYWQDDKAVMDAGQPRINIIESMETKEGLKWLQTDKIPYKNEKGEIIGIIGFAMDITERKRAEDALRETNAYLDNLLNYANAPIIVWSSQFKIIRFNHAFELLTGRNADEVLGQTLDLLFPPAQVQPTMELIQKAWGGERWQTVEIEILHCNGTMRTVLWNSATIFDSDGKTPVATIAQGQDITERKRTEEELKKRMKELERFNKVTMEREKRIIELKKKVKELEQGPHGQK